MRQVKILSFHSIYRLKKIISFVIISIVILGGGLLMWYLNKNFYRTITRAEEVIVLQQEVAPHAINARLLSAVLDKLELRLISYSPEIGSVRNPFFLPALPELSNTVIEEVSGELESTPTQ